VPLPKVAFYEDLFRAQQALEKAIKAVYQFYGKSFRYTHDLDELINALQAKRVDIPQMDESLCPRLTSHYARLESVDSVNETLEKTINKARQSYMEKLNSLAITYVNVASISNFSSRRYKDQ
jgi:HEPN domain-containing protein